MLSTHSTPSTANENCAGARQTNDERTDQLTRPMNLDAFRAEIKFDIKSTIMCSYYQVVSIDSLFIWLSIDINCDWIT